MKFEKLDDTKIRIKVSINEMKANNLSAESFFSNSTDSQKLLNNMLIQAEKKLNFKPEDSQLLVEALVLSDNECVFTITKLKNEKINQKSYNGFTFKFESFDDFINLCNFLNSLEFLCLSEISKNFALIYYKQAYYLTLINENSYTLAVEYIKTFFSEFGQNIQSSLEINNILSEYGKQIFSKDAITKCLNFFVHK